MRWGERIVAASVRRPKTVTWAMVLVALILALVAAAPSFWPPASRILNAVLVDTDPENMLPEHEPVRVYHDAMKRAMSLHDMLVVGVVNETHPEGVFNVESLRRIYELTEYAKTLRGKALGVADESAGVVAVDVIAPSTVDNLEQGGPGVVKFERLMPHPPQTEAEAVEVRRKAARIPFLKGTLLSDDGKGLCIYLPITAKSLSYRVSAKLQEKIASLGGSDQYHITGLPVAEDTFGVEMFHQMAISAPVAMLVIFLLMLYFFRKLVMILAPMIVALVSVIITMSALVITGNTIHIMSSMIPIFIMPISVLDAVHILSDFFDRYQRTRDREATIREVMSGLFTAMLYTSLTTAVGFVSLALTPIPPVQIFGLFVAFGVMVAWLLTVTFIPAYVMFMSDASLGNFGMVHAEEGESPKSLMARFLLKTGRFTFRRARGILTAALVLLAVAAWGITKIRINDNPVKWFTPSHPIRVADRELNKHFAGTYMAFLALEAEGAEQSVEQYAASLDKALAAESASTPAASPLIAKLRAKLKETRPATLLMDRLAALARDHTESFAVSPEEQEKQTAWKQVLSVLESQGAAAAAATDYAGFSSSLAARLKVEQEKMPSAPASDAFRQAAEAVASARGEALLLSALERFASSEAQTADDAEADGWDAILAVLGRHRPTAEVFKQPAALEYMVRLQDTLAKMDVVGKFNSLADIVRTVRRELFTGEESDYRVPDSARGVSDCLTQFQSSNRPQDLWHFVTPDYQKSVLWVQLKSGDNRDMQRVVAAAAAFVAENPPPMPMQAKWFGLTYINVVWQEKMVFGMLSSFLGSFLCVLLMMVLLYRSGLWGLLSMVPLTLTIGLIYGVIGLIGKDYDMPVAVLSSLSLGLAVDYAIHFLARSRQFHAVHGTWERASGPVFGEPARAITRNVIVIGIGFLPLILAPLVPYQTVGVFIAAILITAGIASILILPALVTLLERWLFPQTRACCLLCNAGTCMIVIVSAVALVAVNLQMFVDVTWTTLTWWSLAAIALLGSACAVTSRREKCRTRIPTEPPRQGESQ